MSGEKSSDRSDAVGGVLSHSKLKIPIYQELLNNTNGYEEAVIFNQILYYSDNSKSSSKGLTIYDITRLCGWDKSRQTLRKRLESLEDKGLITKNGNMLYGMMYYKPAPEAWVNDNTLAALIEGRDLNYGDYYTAAIINYFRQRALEGKSKVEISARELSDLLYMDRRRGAVKSRLRELEKAKIIKSSLKGRIYNYEINTDYILNNRTPEETKEAGSKLSEILELHLKRINVISNTNNNIIFQRMLLDGYNYSDIVRIIAFLGAKKSIWQDRVRNASHIRKWYEDLYEDAYRGISKRKANRFLYKLLNGIFEEKKAAAEKNKVPQTAELPYSLSDEQIWQNVINWGESQKNSINYLCYKFGTNTILETEDVYQAMLTMAFNYVKAGKSLNNIKKSYIGKYVKGYLLGKRSQSSDIGDYISEIEDDNISYDMPDYSQKEIPPELLHIPSDELNIVLDYLGRDGKIYNQRDLTEKYNKSLGAINRIINKVMPEICSLYNLPPPNRLLSLKDKIQ